MIKVITTEKIPILQCLFPNFGDSINKILVPIISGKEIISMNKKGLDEFQKTHTETVYSCVGSILGWATPQVEVWGSGFINNIGKPIPRPKKIHAVRGKLTRELLLKQGIDCPEIYGDPVLLMPWFYQPDIKKEYLIGIVPHHVDKYLIPVLKKQFPEALIIDIQEDVYKVIDNINRCEVIISSALHGIICSDAYGIFNIWMKMSEKVLGNGFKFRDYFSSVNREFISPLIYTPNITKLDLAKKINTYNPIEIDLELLWKSCPFKNKEK